MVIILITVIKYVARPEYVRCLFESGFRKKPGSSAARYEIACSPRCVTGSRLKLEQHFMLWVCMQARHDTVLMNAHVTSYAFRARNFIATALHAS